MSLLFDAGLEEYARQCTLQRRNYEDCLHQAQQTDSLKDASHAGASAQADTERAFAKDQPLDRCDEKNLQCCLADLLEISLDPLGWDGKSSVLDETRNVVDEEYQWQSAGTQRAHHSMTNPSGKSMSSVSYGAP